METRLVCVLERRKYFRFMILEEINAILIGMVLDFNRITFQIKHVLVCWNSIANMY